ncbi:MAG TPA: DUF4396 domain-containing protein [Dyella sp.]|nr:DUF4396 domain-containing protein [Dyella sp.]
MPVWLHALAVVSLSLAVFCAAAIALDIALGRRQPMAIMNLVWPITALYAGPLGLWAYARIGRASKAGGDDGGGHGHDGDRPFGQSVMLAATHCGSGCTLGDLSAESLLLAVPFTLFGSELLTGWTLDFVFAFVIGIAFQYFTIKPMGKLSAREALVSALKADTLSLVSWQVGMYGWMAIATFGLFGGELDKAGPVFWFMMQIAMLAGFITACPVNAWLLKRGIKHPM